MNNSCKRKPPSAFLMNYFIFLFLAFIWQVNLSFLGEGGGVCNLAYGENKFQKAFSARQSLRSKAILRTCIGGCLVH